MWGKNLWLASKESAAMIMASASSLSFAPTWKRCQKQLLQFLSNLWQADVCATELRKEPGIKGDLKPGWAPPLSLVLVPLLWPYDLLWPTCLKEQLKRGGWPPSARPCCSRSRCCRRRWCCRRGRACPPCRRSTTLRWVALLTSSPLGWGAWNDLISDLQRTGH